VANCIPEPNLRRLLVGLHLEGEPFGLAAEQHHLVQRRYHRLLCRHRPSRRIRSDSQIDGEGHAPSGSSGIRVGLNVQITEITIHPTDEGLVRACVDIVFDNCLMIRDIRVIQGPTGPFVSFPAKKQWDGTHRQLAYPANAETRMMIQRAILEEYEKNVAGRDPLPTLRSPSERLRALEQLKDDGLINEEEYYSKRKEILGEL
jgi:stage V sporulation protein G